MKSFSTYLKSLLVISALLITIIFSGCNSSDYAKAEEYLANGSYEEAISAFENLGEYKDSKDKLKEAKYKNATELMDNGSYDEAIKLYETIEGYSDTADKIEDCKSAKEEADKVAIYETAVEYLNKGNLTEAKNLFEELGDYKDSAEKIFLTLGFEDTYIYKGEEWKVIDTSGDNYILIGCMGNLEEQFEITRVSTWYETYGDSYLDSYSDVFRDSVVYSHETKRANTIMSGYSLLYTPGGHIKQEEDDKKVFIIYYNGSELGTDYVFGATDHDDASKTHMAMWIDRSSLL